MYVHIYTCIGIYVYTYMYIWVCIYAEIEVERDLKELAHEVTGLANLNFAEQAGRLESQDAGDVVVHLKIGGRVPSFEGADDANVFSLKTLI